MGVYGIKSDKILGYYVTQCGDDPEKPISALAMAAPQLCSL